MNAVAGRRTAVFAAALLAVGILVPGGAVLADTGYLAYSCALPVLGSTDFQISADSNAPSPMYLGKSFGPTLTTKAQIPASLANQVAEGLNASSVDGTITYQARINGVVTPITQTFSSTTIPETSTAPVTVTARGPLPKLTANAVGSITYLPGDLTITLTFRKPGGESVGEFEDIDCTMPPNSKVIDKVVYAKSPSAVAPAVGYSKSARKVTATAKVTARSGLVPTGKVVAVLYKGKTKLKTRSANLAGGKARITFTGVSKPGGYKVVLTFTGNARTNASTASRRITIR